MEDEIKECLSHEEMDSIETASYQKKLREAQIREIEYKRQIVQLKFQAAVHEKDYEILKCDNIKARAIEVSAAKNDSHREFIDTLKDKYKITGNFGYNPETGEIVRED